MNGDPTLMDYLNFGSNTATGVLGALNNKPNTVVQQGATNWGMIAAIGGGVVLLLVVVLSLGRK